MAKRPPMEKLLMSCSPLEELDSNEKARINGVFDQLAALYKMKENIESGEPNPKMSVILECPAKETTELFQTETDPNKVMGFVQLLIELQIKWGQYIACNICKERVPENVRKRREDERDSKDKIPETAIRNAVNAVLGGLKISGIDLSMNQPPTIKDPN